MADDTSLLLRIRGDAAGAKAAAAETRAAIAQLRTGLGTDFQQIENSGNKVIASLTDKLNIFVGQRIPLIGGAFVRVSENIRGLGSASDKGAQDLAKVEKTIESLSTKIGKGTSETKTFLTSFLQMSTQAERDTAAIKFLGSAFDEKLIPELENAAKGLGAVAVSSEAAGVGFAGMAGPIGLAVVGLIASAAAAGLAAKAIFGLIRSAAELEGNFIDLSQQTGVSTETLSALAVVASTTGGSIESVTQSLVLFQRNLEEAQDPASKAAETFENLGISTKDTETSLREALTALAAMPEGFHQTNAAAELFGARGGKQFLAILKEMHGDLPATIARLRELGLIISKEDAEAADAFNDQLRILGLQIEHVAADIARDAIPAMREALTDISRVLTENRDAINALGQAFSLFVTVNIKVLQGALGTLNAILQDVRDSWIAIKIAALLASGGSIEAAQEIIEALNKAKAAASQKPFLPIPGAVAGVGALGEPDSPDARASRERLAQAKFEADEQKRLSEDRIAQTDKEYEQGRITREKQKNETIAALKAESDAQLKKLQLDEEAKQQELARLEDEPASRRKVAAEIDAIRQRERDLQSDTSRKIADEEAQAQADQTQNLIRYWNDRLDIEKANSKRAVDLVEARISAGELFEKDGVERIRVIQEQLFALRRKYLNLELGLALNPEQRAQILQQRKELNQEILDEEQKLALRLKAVRQKEFEDQRALLLSHAEALLRIGNVRDQAEIASLRELARLRVITEEDAEKQILAIRLAALDREEDAIRARLTAAQSIRDPAQRIAEEQKLNDELEIIRAERSAIEAEGDRDIQAGRERDLESRRQYADEIKKLDFESAQGELDERRRNIERVAERLGLNSKTIAAFRQLALDEAKLRHDRIVAEINAQEAEAHAIDVGNKNKLEIEERYNALREQENQRFHRQQEDINAPGGARVSGGAAPSALSQLNTAIIENLSGNTLTAAQAGVEALAGAFQSLGQAVGQAVEAYVLYGKAGVSVRQVTAQILASVAQQAAVKAIFELAEGFAALALAFFGVPNAGPSAAAHFQAAAIYGLIAGVAAIAGRAVAGNSFNQQNSAVSSGGARGSSGSGQISTIDLIRNQNRLDIYVHAEPGGGFNDAVVRALVTDVRRNGDSRDVIIHTATSGS